MLEILESSSILATVKGKGKVLVKQKDNNPNQLDILVMRDNGIKDVAFIDIKDCEEARGFNRAIFEELKNRGYNVKKIEYYTKRNTRESKKEFRYKDCKF